MQMKRLEEEVGKPLFIRNRKMLVLTDAGELLLLSGRIEPFDGTLPNIQSLTGTLSVGL